MIERVFNFSSITTDATAPAFADPRSDYERLTALRFHLESGDYFPFLSTLLGFVEESFTNDNNPQELVALQLEAVRAARKDLHFLHQHCRIEPRA